MTKTAAVMEEAMVEMFRRVGVRVRMRVSGLTVIMVVRVPAVPVMVLVVVVVVLVRVVHGVSCW